MSIAPALALVAPLSLFNATAATASEMAHLTQPQAIDQAVEGFTGRAIGQEGGAINPVDPRLRLAACSAPLTLDWYGQPGRTVSVACSGLWQIYVNVQQAPRPAVAEPAIRRGEAVTIAVRGRGFSVQQRGEARSSGAVGDWIMVRTNRRAATIRARVIRPGLVEVEQV